MLSVHHVGEISHTLVVNISQQPPRSVVMGDNTGDTDSSSQIKHTFPATMRHRVHGGVILDKGRRLWANIESTFHWVIPCQKLNPFSAGIDYRCKNRAFIDVRF